MVYTSTTHSKTHQSVRDPNMNRLFGVSSNKTPKPSIADAINSTDERIDGIQVKVKKLDGELGKYRDQMKKMRDGPGKVSVACSCTSKGGRP